MRYFSWLTPTLIVAVLFGSLAGSVFTWWVNREPPLTVGYLISTTSTGTDATTKSLVPGLSLRIDAKDIPAIHTHVISLSRTSGYADRVELAATFNQPLQVFGSSFAAPSPVHTISCQMIASGSKCTLGPMDGQGEYRISLATDSAAPPVLTIAGRNTQLASLADIASRNSRFKDIFGPDFLFGWLLALLAGALVSALSSWKVFARLLQRERRMSESEAAYLLSEATADADQTQDDHPSLRIGTKVRHQQFGVGTVTMIERHNEDWKITVRFPSVGVKKLLDKYAKLEVVE